MNNKYIFKKYEFADEATAQAKIDALPSATEDGNTFPTHSHSIVKLGQLWTEQPTYDENGDVVTPGVQADNYSLDVLWRKAELLDENGDVVFPDGWAAAEVQYDENTWSGVNGAHTFMGWTFGS